MTANTDTDAKNRANRRALFLTALDRMVNATSEVSELWDHDLFDAANAESPFPRSLDEWLVELMAFRDAMYNAPQGDR